MSVSAALGVEAGRGLEVDRHVGGGGVEDNGEFVVVFLFYKILLLLYGL